MRNLISLLALQASNAIMPLLAFPYCLNVLGAKLFSDIAISQSWNYFIVTAVLYSFSITGVKDIIANSRNLNVQTNVFYRIFYSRIFIFLLCCIFIITSSFFMQIKLRALMCAWLSFPLSYIFQSSFFFIAVEDNFFVAVVSCVTRVIGVVLIFLFVKKSTDFILVPIFYGSAYLFGGVISFFYIIKSYKIKPISIDLNTILLTLREGKDVFFANLSVVFYKDFNIIMLSFTQASVISVSLYSLVSKYISTFQAALRPLNQYYYPKIASLLLNKKTSKKSATHLIFSKTRPQLWVLTFGLCACILLAYLFRMYYMEYKHIELILTLVCLMLAGVYFGLFNFMFGSAGLVLLGYQKRYLTCMLITAVFSLLLGFLLCSLFSAVGASINFSLSECVLTTLTLIAYTKPSKIMLPGEK